MTTTPSQIPSLRHQLLTLDREIERMGQRADEVKDVSGLRQVRQELAAAQRRRQVLQKLLSQQEVRSEEEHTAMYRDFLLLQDGRLEAAEELSQVAAGLGIDWDEAQSKVELFARVHADRKYRDVAHEIVGQRRQEDCKWNRHIAGLNAQLRRSRAQGKELRRRRKSDLLQLSELRRQLDQERERFRVLEQQLVAAQAGQVQLTDSLQQCRKEQRGEVLELQGQVTVLGRKLDAERQARLTIEGQLREAREQLERRSEEIETHLSEVEAWLEDQEELLKAGERVLAHPCHGYLLAVAMAEAGDAAPFGATRGAVLDQVKRLLSARSSDKRFFGDRVQGAISACNSFRQGRCSFGDLVEETGITVDTNVHDTVLAFVEHSVRWQKEHAFRQRVMYHHFQEGKCSFVKEITHFLAEHGYPARPDGPFFVSIWDSHPVFFNHLSRELSGTSMRSCHGRSEA